MNVFLEFVVLIWKNSITEAHHYHPAQNNRYQGNRKKGRLNTHTPVYLYLSSLDLSLLLVRVLI